MRFSVVTICLNPGRYLESAMNSVLGQDYTDIEYVLIDGGSTDGSQEIIQRYAASDPRIKWRSSQDAGIADAMNRGVRSCHGEIVSFLHADDRYADSAALSDVNGHFAINPQALWLTGGLREINSYGNVVRELPVRTFSYRRLLRNNILYHPATFVRREVFDQVGFFDANLRYAMDYDFWLRLARVSPPVTTNRILAEFRVHEGSLSSSHKRATVEEEYLVRCRYLRGWLGRLGHAFYHSVRRRSC